MGKLKTLNAATEIEALALHGDHAHRRVFDRGGAVTTLCFSDLVGLPFVLHVENSEILTLVGEQQLVTNDDVIAVGVHHDRQTEQLTGSQTVAADHGVIVLLVHEPTQGRETTDRQQLHVAGIAIGTLKGFGRGGLHGGPVSLRHHEINERAAVGGDHTGLGSRSAGGHDRPERMDIGAILPDRSVKAGSRHQDIKKGGLCPPLQ